MWSSSSRSAPKRSPRTQWSLFWRRFFRHRLAVGSLLALVVLVILCFAAHTVAPYSPTKIDITLVGAAHPPSLKHWFGTDELGRDQLSVLLYAGQISLRIGLAVAAFSTVLGVLVGAAAGYFGSIIDRLLSAATDLFLVVPQLALLAVALKHFGRSPNTIIVVLALLGWTYIARVVRGQVLSLKEKEFVEAARASGASSWRIIIRHILPNLVGAIMVNLTLSVAVAIVAESTLSFLGFGVNPPRNSWGLMLSDQRGCHQRHVEDAPAALPGPDAVDHRDVRQLPRRRAARRLRPPSEALSPDLGHHTRPHSRSS